MKLILFVILFSSFGSFLGLVVDRFPEESIIWPRSHCNSCGKTLKVIDLIPVFSQLINKHSCRFCGQPIPSRYLLIELISGGIGLAFANQLLTCSQVTLLFFGMLLSLYDIKEQAYPFVLWVIFTLGLLLIFPINLLSIILFLLGLLASLQNLKIGSGDFLYLATLALVLDFQTILWIVQLASLLGILAFLLKQTKHKTLPFVPFLFMGYLLILFLK